MNPEPTVVICYGGAEPRDIHLLARVPWTVGSSRGSPAASVPEGKEPPERGSAQGVTSKVDWAGGGVGG